MTESLKDQHERRGIAARIGICLLNLWNPGLGMVRLGHYRTAILLIGLAHAAWGIAVAYYAFGPTLSYATFLTVAGGALGVWLTASSVGVVLSWWRSRLVKPRDGWLWRWYGVVGLGAGLSAVSLLTPEAGSYYKSFYAVSESMAPTLRPDDRFIADMRGREPLRRGDLVIVRTFDKDYILRLAGLPGDTIALVGGVVLIDGKPLAQRPAGQAGDARVLHEQFPGERAAHAILDRGPMLYDDMAPVTLGPDQFFVLGDNRDNASDSRFDETVRGPGLVGREGVRGRVLFRYWRSGEGLEGVAF